MKRTEPPYLLDCLLLFLLSQRDRETVSGDLYEEFLDVKLPELGQFMAHLWYMGQVLSFVPGRIEAVLLQGHALRLLCFSTALAGGWLGMMDILLRHPGYRSQIVIAATIVSQAALTLAALRFHRYRSLRAIAMVGSAAILWLAGIALKATIGGAHLEGYPPLRALVIRGLLCQTYGTPEHVPATPAVTANQKVVTRRIHLSVSKAGPNWSQVRLMSVRSGSGRRASLLYALE